MSIQQTPLLNSLKSILCIGCLLASVLVAQESDTPLRGVLVSAQHVDQHLSTAEQTGITAIVLSLDDDAAVVATAANQIRASGLDLYYWIEIGRHEPTADAHPLWMASLQGHHEWRRLFPKAAQPKSDEVVKVYPWVPILYREAFDEHLRRVRQLLAEKPTPKGILLNNLQAAPSACGCGNILCRWTTDYGPVQTASPLGPDSAAQFVAEVTKLAPMAEVIPVWVTECEEHDREGPCAGVGCFQGLCWKEYAKQLSPLAAQSRRIGVLLPLREFERELPTYRQPAGWITHALSTFQTMPPRYGQKAVESARLISVLQGWDVTEAEVKMQIDRAIAARTGGYVVSRMPINQRWEPRIVRYKD